ncbi:replication endonuclease [Shewanella japonica]|uniref:replication endonuclease n=1 Tax=Shewanella japonica TaxID=93973 RepID=UPI000E77122E|nr:replication endonuclease [Shewanella japonica]
MKIKSPAYAVVGHIDGYTPNFVKVKPKVNVSERVKPLGNIYYLPKKIQNKLTNNYSKRLKSVVKLKHVQAFDAETEKQLGVLSRVWQQYPFKLVPYGASMIRYRKTNALIAQANTNANEAYRRIQAASDGGSSIFSAYTDAAKLCKHWQVNPPYENAVLNDGIKEAAECGILRMICPKWWLGKLSAIRDQCIEHLFIAAGMVGKHLPYISNESFSEWRTQKRNAQAWLESTMIESEDGMMLPLADASNAGVANPKNRFTELVVRARGLEEMAQDAGKKGLFITLTAPSKYHAVSHKWNEQSPKAAQKYLVTQWAKIRSKLKRQDIDMTGLRVVEPHKDGTPHWHLLAFVAPNDVDEFKSILHDYAFEVDGNENGAAKNRLLIENIDPSKGSAVGYVIKYISKNIAAEHMDDEQDFTADCSASHGAMLASAWASRHNIRQFQFFGTSSVSIWRELRRLSNGGQDIEQARTAADQSNWLEFEKALSVTPLKLDYEETECGNEYGEIVKRIKGLITNSTVIVTREMRWKLRPMENQEKIAFSELKKSRALINASNTTLDKAERIQLPTWTQPALDVDFRSPWTCGNNYTLETNSLNSLPKAEIKAVIDGSDMQEHITTTEMDSKFVKALKAVGVVDDLSVNQLLAGAMVICDSSGLAYQIVNNCLVERNVN